jgi:peptide/nickel transport system ATP-binding protein
MLKAENISKHFVIHHNPLVRLHHRDHLIRAVDGVSLELRPGDLTGLIGESGSGKTTLAKTLVGLYQPTSGCIYYQNRDISGLEKPDYRRFRREVQMIFQDPDSTLDPRMTLKELMEEPLRIQHQGDVQQRKRQIQRTMAQVNLAESFLGRFPSELSGGQRQRLAIARTLLMEPRLIVADEPLAGLDSIIRMQILRLLLEIKKELGLTYLLVTHDLEMAAAVCSRIAVFYRGQIVEFLDGADFENKALHPYTAFLKKGAEDSPPSVSDHDLHHVRTGQSGGCSFAAHCPQRIAICTQQIPELEEIEAGHGVRCWEIGPPAPASATLHQ